MGAFSQSLSAPQSSAGWTEPERKIRGAGASFASITPIEIQRPFALGRRHSTARRTRIHLKSVEAKSHGCWPANGIRPSRVMICAGPSGH